MSFELFFGMIIGFIISFLVLKRSINKAGCGELRMCRDKCPYYRSIEVDNKKKFGEDDDE